MNGRTDRREEGPVAWLRRTIEADLAAAKIISSGGFAPQHWDTEPPGQVNPAKIPQDAAVTTALGCESEYICGWVQLVAYDKGIEEPDERYGRDSEAPFALVDNGRREFDHIIRHDPRNAVADCEAKLALIDLCARVILDDEGHEYYSDGWSGLAVARLTLAFLAAGYKHHAGYRGEDWKS